LNGACERYDEPLKRFDGASKSFAGSSQRSTGEVEGFDATAERLHGRSLTLLTLPAWQ
jgi:hypothetical protein